MDNVTNTGHYQVSNANAPANSPSWGGLNSLIVVMKWWYGSRGIQIVMEMNNRYIGYRYFQANPLTFTNWFKLSTT